MSDYIDETAKIGEGFKAGRNVVIEKNVAVGSNVNLGHNVVIRTGTKIGDNVSIGDNSVLGKQPKLAPTSTIKIERALPPLEIGSGCLIGAGVVLSAGSKLENNVTVGDVASVREKCLIGEYVVIGRGVAVENETTIGVYTKIQTGAYITAYMTIEDHVFVAPMVVTTNDNYMGRTEERFKHLKGPHIKRGARVGGGSVLLPGVTIGEEAFVAAGAVVTKDVPDKKLVMGIPARVVRDVPKEELLESQ